MKLRNFWFVMSLGTLFILLIVLGTWFGVELGREPTENQQISGQQNLKLGVVLPLTGATARYGHWIKNALELARDQHNSNPSSRYRIDFIIEDDKGTASDAVSATRKLISIDRVPTIFGTWSSSGVLAMAPVVQESGVVLMADAVSPQIRGAGEWVFRCVPDARMSLAVLDRPLKQSQRLAVIYINNDFGKDLADYIVSMVGAGPPTLVINEGYEANTESFRTVLEKIRASNADSIFIAGYTEQGVFLRQKKELGLKAKIFASPSFENVDIIEQARGAAEGVIYPNYFDPNSNIPEMRSFLDEYQRRFGEPAEGFGASGYAGMQALLAAIERATDTRPASIRQALGNLGVVKSVFGDAYIDEEGDLRYPIFLKQVNGGEFARMKQ